MTRVVATVWLALVFLGMTACSSHKKAAGPSGENLSALSALQESAKTAPVPDHPMSQKEFLAANSGEAMTGKNSEGTPTYYPSGNPYDFNTQPMTVAGITFSPASQWESSGGMSPRIATFTFGPLGTDADSAVLGVFYFGETQGGSVDANIDRWIHQMELPDGADPKTVARAGKLVADGMTVDLVSIRGTYLSSIGAPMSGKFERKENYVLVGAIVEGPQGNVFFKLTGPDYTARIMLEALVPMLGQIHRAA